MRLILDCVNQTLTNTYAAHAVASAKPHIGVSSPSKEASHGDVAAGIRVAIGGGSEDQAIQHDITSVTRWFDVLRDTFQGS